MNKEPLKTRDPYRYYRNCSYACIVGEYASVLSPIAIVFGAKWNEYFTVADGNQVKMTVGCILSLVVAAIVMLSQIKRQEKINNQHTMLPFVFGVGVAFALSYLFKVVIDDLTLILGVELAGSVTAYGIDFATIANKEKMMIYKDEEIRHDARRVAEEKVESKTSSRFSSILNEKAERRR